MTNTQTQVEEIAEEHPLKDIYAQHVNSCIELGIDHLSYDEWLNEIDSIGK